MSYFWSDVKKLYKSTLVKFMLIALLICIIADCIARLIHALHYSSPNIPNHPFVYWLMMPTGIGHQIYYSIFWWLPVISTGLVFYNEQSTSVMQLSVIRGKWYKYYFSKAFSLFLFTFINFFALLIISIIITFILHDSNAPKIGQYSAYIPMQGTFAYPFYEKGPIYMCILYAFINALALALLSLIMFSFHAIVKIKNQFVALLAPATVLYAVKYLFAWILKDNDNFNKQMQMIIQPSIISRASQLAIITTNDVIISYSVTAVIALILLIIGYFRERELV